MSSLTATRSADTERASPPAVLKGRWLQLAVAVVGMMAIAPLQYSWTLYTSPLADDVGWSLASIQLGFTLFVVAQTFLQPVGGYFFDRFSPRFVYAVGGVLAGGGWALIGVARSLPELYVFYALAGVGAAIVYVGSLGSAARWFPHHRRGLAVGMTAAGFGSGAAPFIPFVNRSISQYGPHVVFVVTGVASVIVIVACALVMRRPPQEAPSIVASQTDTAPGDHSLKPWQLLSVPRFWLVYGMFLCMATGGLVVTANVKPFAQSLGYSSALIVAVVTLQQILNGFSRVFWGWISDRIGRYSSMFIAFGLNAVFLALTPILGRTSVGFLVLIPLVLFTWGEIFSLFAALTVDLFGAAYAASNQGLMNTAKGIGALLAGGLAGWMAASLGWTPVFVSAAALAAAAAVGAWGLRRQSVASPQWVPKPVETGK